VTEVQVEREFKKKGAPEEHEYDKYRNSDTHPDIDTMVPTYRLR